MRSVRDFGEIHLHKAPVDGRKQINGLAQIVQGAMGKSPFGGALFVFTTRRRDYVKLLYWNRSGFALWVHRLEEEKFRWPAKMDGDVIELSVEQLEGLLQGYDITPMKPHATLAYSAVS
jgi:transposase